MDADFWHDRWANNQIGFHQGRVNRLLAAHVGVLGLERGDRVFLPLCGKTRDIAWLLGKGFRVAGAELSELAITQLFEELGVEPEITDLDRLRRYSAPGLDIFVGDLFDVSADSLGPVDAIYDRAALVALPHDMRPDYGAHLARITGTARQLLVCFEHAIGAEAGPPFSVGEAEITRVYDSIYNLKLLEKVAVEGGIKGDPDGRETAWHLTP